MDLHCKPTDLSLLHVWAYPNADARLQYPLGRTLMDSTVTPANCNGGLSHFELNLASFDDPNLATCCRVEAAHNKSRR